MIIVKSNLLFAREKKEVKMQINDFNNILELIKLLSIYSRYIIMNRTGWTEEERTMYDDRTRKLDGYYAHLEYVAEEKQLARMEGMEEGIEKGRAEGAITTIIGLIKDGILTIESGAKQLNMSESELTAYMQ